MVAWMDGKAAAWTDYELADEMVDILVGELVHHSVSLKVGMSAAD